MTLYSIVKRGRNKGIEVEPNVYLDGKYHVAKSKDGGPTPADKDELMSYVQRGYGIRMGNKQMHHPPGLFMPHSILSR
jgi:hypothetical protein